MTAPVSLGVDIGGTSVKAALVRGGVAIAMGASGRYARPDTGLLTRAITDAVRALGPVPEGVAAGVCAPGIPDDSGERIAYAANAPGLAGRDLRGVVSAAAGPLASFRLVGDALASALGYAAERPTAGRLLCLALGTGVGACVLDDGVPLTLTDGSAGHIGQIDVGVTLEDGTVPVGPDGGAGSLEAYVGLPALRGWFGEDPLPGLLATPMAHPAYLALVRAIRVCHAVYRPGHIGLLGGIGIALRPRADELAETVARGLTGVARPGWTLGCGGSAGLGAIGAALSSGAPT